ncbi:unnamed protein product [Clonostachys byssicola]|uniref:Uncharacterized protein n=1 Tax=Clonostachys byssicola TaxID=160290 RepID=A0A9N9TY49_9HYPO|nr:unnamed protein product [Clonostachys byssicola]
MPGYKLILKGLVALCFLLEASANNSDLDDPRFIGYFFDAGKTTIERMSAPSSLYTKFTTSGKFAGPCPNYGSKCEVNTMCEDNTLSGPDITNVPCTSLSSCQTMTILQTSPAGGPMAKYIFCGLVWSAHTVYREPITSSTTSTSSLKDSTVTSTEMLSATASAVLMTSTSDLPPKGTSEAGSSSSSAVSSQAWIAGPVLGGVIVLGLLVAGGFWWGNRYRRHEEPMNLQSSSDNTPLNKPIFPTGSAYFPGRIPMNHQNNYRETSMPSSTLMELGSDAETYQHSRSYPELPASPQQIHSVENRA